MQGYYQTKVGCVQPVHEAEQQPEIHGGMTERRNGMDYSKLTLADCIRKLEQEKQEAVIEDGAVTRFVER